MAGTYGASDATERTSADAPAASSQAMRACLIVSPPLHALSSAESWCCACTAAASSSRIRARLAVLLAEPALAAVLMEPCAPLMRAASVRSSSVAPCSRRSFRFVADANTRASSSSAHPS
eukprot:5894382-Pleurochrysis_carterae.AAC.2